MKNTGVKDDFGLERVKSVESDLNAEEKQKEKEQQKNEKEDDEGSETAEGTQHINTSKTKNVEGKDREVLIGKDLDKVKDVKEEFDSLERKLLNRFT